jgi:RNA polymerase sigma-70 factor (ECF subfamily)
MAYACAVRAPADASALDDAALAAAVARGDEAAEAELCRRLGPRVRLYGLRHLRDRHAAADLAQQVLLMTLERLREGKLRQPAKLASFVLGMCRLVVLDIRRGAARRAALLERYAGAGEAQEPGEPLVLDQERLARCLEALSERERSVLVLAFAGGKDAAETAREIATSAANVRVIRHRALAKVRDCMGLA